MNAHKNDDCGLVDCTSKQALSTEAISSLHSLQGLQRQLTTLRREMHDLAEWQSAQSTDQPATSNVFRAAERSMDQLSEEAMAICDSMAALAVSTVAGIKCKASALEYLLPEEPDDMHVVLCRSLCADIRGL